MFRTSPAFRTDAGLVNAMSVDVEDWFQVSAFERVIAPDTWDARACRVERNVDRILALFAGHGVRATFFTLGWIAERYPQTVRRIVAGGHVFDDGGLFAAEGGMAEHALQRGELATAGRHEGDPALTHQRQQPPEARGHRPGLVQQRPVHVGDHEPHVVRSGGDRGPGAGRHG